MRKRVVLSLLLALSLAGSALGAEKLEDFTLKQMAGPPVTLSDYQGKQVVLISFWATWCSACKAEMPHLQRLYKSYGDKGFIILGINTDEARKFADVRSVAASKGLTYPVLLDPETLVLSTLNPSMTLPYAILLGKDGLVKSTYAGYSPGDELVLEKEVKALLGEAASGSK